MKKVRVGIVGPSWWVDYWHLPALLNHPDAEIAAVCSARPRSSEELSEKYGNGELISSFTNLETMLDSVQLDGVVVCTPNDLHYPSTMAALIRGVHVTCEKPVALNACQAREMAEAARDKGLIGMSNFPYRSNPCAVLMQDKIKEGFAGPLLHVSGQYHGGFGLNRPPGWRGSRKHSGSGILGDLGSHLIDLARFATGDEFSSVTATSLTVLTPTEPEIGRYRSENPDVGDRNDDSCAFLAEFASGAQGIFHTSWMAYQGAYVQHQELEVFGTLGRLKFLSTHTGTYLKGLRNGEKKWENFAVAGTTPYAEDGEDNEDFFRPGRHDCTNNTYRWISAIRDGANAISPDLWDGLRSQLVIDAVIEASASRCWVDVPNF